MPFISTPNCIEVVVKATQNTIPVVNVYHVRVTGGVDDTKILDAATVFEDWMTNYMLANLHNSYVFEEVVATDISVPNGHQYTVASTGGGNGGTGGDPAAANAALVVSWRTANTGRSFRGRTYVGGLPQTALQDAQNVTTTYGAAVLADMGALMSLLAVVGQTLAVLSKYANLVQRITGLLTDIVTIIIDTKVDSQRRRTAN